MTGRFAGGQPPWRCPHEASRRQSMTTFAALGDSITLGVGDPVRLPGGWAWRGWPALLAGGMRPPSLHVLASCGARIADVERDQLPSPPRRLPANATVR